ncbi:MAG: agglutinin biogenesis protein MshP [Undibacterium sp.]|nr:agglutinin biogenesis protein MshP [Undibacterium sp.]
MYPKNQISPSLNQQRVGGFSLVTAIFLLVILAALGVFMLSVYSTQRASVNMDIRGARAYQAAKAGIEWATLQVLASENGVLVASSFVCPAGNMAGMPALAGALQGFNVTTSCVLTSRQENANFIRVYQITAVSSIGAFPSQDYVERNISASVFTCRVGTGVAGEPRC